MASRSKRESTETGEKGRITDVGQQLEAIRKEGKVNMLDRDGVQRQAAMAGHRELVAHLEGLRYNAHGYLDLLRASRVDVTAEQEKAAQEMNQGDGSNGDS